MSFPTFHPGQYHRGKCTAQPAEWRVVDRNCNYSAFNGSHYTPSDYSSVKCLTCRTTWRTKANYVGEIADATPRERIL